jgi:hypothetical protein
MRLSSLVPLTMLALALLGCDTQQHEVTPSSLIAPDKLEAVKRDAAKGDFDALDSLYGHFSQTEDYVERQKWIAVGVKYKFPTFYDMTIDDCISDIKKLKDKIVRNKNAIKCMNLIIESINMIDDKDDRQEQANIARMSVKEIFAYYEDQPKAL